MSYLSGWSKFIRLTVAAADTDAALSGFSVPVRISTASGLTDKDVSAVFDEIGNNWKKVAFQLGEGTELYAEMEFWDSVNEVGLFHVKADLADSDNVIRMYFDSTHADNDSYIGAVTSTPAQAVWDTSTKRRYGLAQDPTGGTGCIKDSTSNAGHGTPSGTWAAGDLVTADYPYGKGLDFRGSHYIDIPDAADLTPTSAGFTVEAVYSLDSLTNAAAVGKRANGAYEWAPMEFTTNLYWQTLTSSGSALSQVATSASPLTTVRYIVGTVASDGKARLFINGVLIGTGSAAAFPSNTSATVRIGYTYFQQDRFFDGKIHEVRISAAERSAAWISATYKGLNDTLITFSDVFSLHEGNITASAGVSAELAVQYEYDCSLTASAAADCSESGKDAYEIIAAGDGGSELDGHIAETSASLGSAGTGSAVLSVFTVRYGDISAGGVGSAVQSAQAEWSVTLAADGESAADYVTPALTEAVSSFNWTQVQKKYKKVFIPRYYLTMSKSDGTNPVEIPMSSFQAKLRSRGYPWEEDYEDIADLMEKRGSSVSVEIPDGQKYADTIASLGSYAAVKIDKSLMSPDGLEYREQIIEAILKKLTYNIQVNNNNLNIYAMFLPKPAPAKTVPLISVTSKNIADGIRTYSFAEIDLFLRAADIINCGEEIVVGELDYTVKADSELMVVKENEYYDVSDTETGAATKETIGCQPKSSTNMSYNPATGGWSGLAGWAEIGIENV